MKIHIYEKKAHKLPTKIGKKSNVTNHQRNLNQNCNELPTHSIKNSDYQNSNYNRYQQGNEKEEILPHHW